MSLPQIALLEKIYSELVRQNTAGLQSLLPTNMTFNVAGKSSLAGKYTHETFLTEYCAKLKSGAGGNLKMEIHDILASDRHATVLLTYTVEQSGAPSQIRAVHVWRIENQQPIAGYEYPRDMYQYDSIWK